MVREACVRLRRPAPVTDRERSAEACRPTKRRRTLGHSILSATDQRPALCLLEEWRDRPLRSLGAELAVILVRRAKRVSLSKMYMTRDGRPFVPTRLRDRDGVLSVRGEEGAGDVALRTDTLAEVLAGLGVLTKDAAGVYRVTEYCTSVAMRGC